MEFTSLEPKKVQKRKQWNSAFLYFTAFTANINHVALGINLVWTSPIISKLKSTDVQVNPLGIPITTYQISLIAGLLFLGSMVGPLMIGKLADIFGRKKILNCTVLTSALAYIVLALAQNINFYYFSRVVLGICQGTSMTVLPIYITEITEKHNRGKFGCLTGLFCVLGSLYGYVLGPFFSVKIFNLLCAAPLIISSIIMLALLPESPHFLIYKGHTVAAKVALQKLRNKSDISLDLKDIEKTLNENAKATADGPILIFRNPIYFRALMICFGLILLQVLCGTTVILAFMGPICDQANSGLSGDNIAVIVILVKISISFLTSIIVEKAGRRTLLFISSIGAAVVHFCIGIFFYLQDHAPSSIAKVMWLPIIFVILFIIVYSLGIGPVIPVVYTELFPNDLRALAVSMIISVFAFTAFCVTALFPIVVGFLGHSGSFWIFGGFSFLGALLVYFFVPETKGKTLLEIQEMLRKHLN